jgi:hypothetical protein
VLTQRTQSFFFTIFIVTPAQAGVQGKWLWIPACAGMTEIQFIG